MIQVCSRCGTRWNVRDRQRVWCPRCNGTLLAPSDTAARPEQGWAPQATTNPQGKATTPTRLPPGYRWIAVRPGSGPPPRKGRFVLGPTPRYATIPRWGLQDDLPPVPPLPVEAKRPGPSPALVRVLAVLTVALFGAAALMHVVRYALMLVNRTYLLPPFLAIGVNVLTVLVSALAVLAVIGFAVAATNWLVARRAAAFARHELPETRSTTVLYLGCLVPVVNLLFAPVFVIELAAIEGRLRDLRTSIVAWWCAWVVSFLVSSWAVTTTVMSLFRPSTQRIADSTLTTAVGYLIALVALLMLAKVFNRFERTPVDKPVKRWVMVGAAAAAPPVEDARVPDGESAFPVESARRDPAA